MKDIKTAQLLMHKARNDCAALEHMIDADKFSEEIFGFHAQQAIEKGLKSVLALRGVVYPRTHDIYALIRSLENTGINTSPFDDLVELNIYTVQGRYDAYCEAEQPLERNACLQKVQQAMLRLDAIFRAFSGNE